MCSPPISSLPGKENQHLSPPPYSKPPSPPNKQKFEPSNPLESGGMSWVLWVASAGGVGKDPGALCWDRCVGGESFEGCCPATPGLRRGRRSGTIGSSWPGIPTARLRRTVLLASGRPPPWRRRHSSRGPSSPRQEEARPNE